MIVVVCSECKRNFGVKDENISVKDGFVVLKVARSCPFCKNVLPETMALDIAVPRAAGVTISGGSTIIHGNVTGGNSYGG